MTGDQPVGSIPVFSGAVMVPLAEIPDSLALVTESTDRPFPSTDDGHSCASSSWKALSSNQSGLSHVSQDSLSGLAFVDAMPDAQVVVLIVALSHVVMAAIMGVLFAARGAAGVCGYTF